MAIEGTGDPTLRSGGTRGQVTGRVASVNPAGLKLDGATTWLNFSRFAPDLLPPERGQYVSLTLDRQGFIRTVTVRDHAYHGAPPAFGGDPHGGSGGGQQGLSSGSATRRRFQARQLAA